MYISSENEVLLTRIAMPKPSVVFDMTYKARENVHDRNKYIYLNLINKCPEYYFAFQILRLEQQKLDLSY